MLLGTARLYSIFTLNKKFTHKKKYVIKYPQHRGKLLPPAARATLVDRLIDWSRILKSRQETLYLSVYILDRFLNEDINVQIDMNLLCATCFFIAMKFEEVKIIRVRDLVSLTHNMISATDIFALEHVILKTIDFQLIVVSPYDFLKRLFLINTVDNSHCNLNRHHGLLLPRTVPLLRQLLYLHRLNQSLRSLPARCQVSPAQVRRKKNQALHQNR
jgi:hypothetical protein